MNHPISRLANLIEEWRLGISTRGTAAADRPGAVHYATMNYSSIRRLLRRLDLQPSDIFVDIGCGKGRVLCLAAQYEMRQVVGVEYSPERVSIARHNVSQTRKKRTPVEIHAMAAEEFDYSSATVLYFFNPFDAHILDVVLDKVHADRAMESLRLAFVMESPEQRAVFDKHKWLQCYDRWTDGAGHLNYALYRTTQRLG